jgi:hypothetical protein
MLLLEPVAFFLWQGRTSEECPRLRTIIYGVVEVQIVLLGDESGCPQFFDAFYFRVHGLSMVSGMKIGRRDKQDKQGWRREAFKGKVVGRGTLLLFSSSIFVRIAYPFFPEQKEEDKGWTVMKKGWTVMKKKFEDCSNSCFNDGIPICGIAIHQRCTR